MFRSRYSFYNFTLSPYMHALSFFFLNDTATTEIYPLSLHDALPIWSPNARGVWDAGAGWSARGRATSKRPSCAPRADQPRSEEHTSELQSRQYLVCRLLLGKKKR